MDDDCHTRLRLRADYESRRQACLQVLNALKAIGQAGEQERGVICFGGFTMLSEPLRHVTWPPRFRLEVSARFDGLSDPVGFMQRYTIAIRETRGNGCIMANWFPMATKGVPHRWL
jgi:hypothetical protein